MRSFCFNGYDFGEWTRAKAVRESSGFADAPKVVRLKVFLEPGAKADAEALEALRRRMRAALFSSAPGELRYLESCFYREAICTNAGNWDTFLEAGSCELEFTIGDPAAYGAERQADDDVIDVKGTWRTYPVVEGVAEAGDSVMVLHRGLERFVNVVHQFRGGEVVAIDFEGERVSIDGADACADIGIYSDFFALQPGENRLAFAGFESHTLRYFERWL